MDMGVWILNTDDGIRIDELARAVEERGFESLWVAEHTHIPVSRRTPYPRGGELPRSYSRTLDPFIALATAAAVTTRLRIGTGICLMIQRDPIITAKQVASLDLQSTGRFLFGIGGGWNVEEMENHGTRFESRFRLLRERVLAMKEIWTRDEAEFHGEFVDFDAIYSWPKPVQKPHPPILLGGESSHTLQRVVDFCDGWIPRGHEQKEAAVLAAIRELKERAARRGRDMKAISISPFNVSADTATLDRYREAGVSRAILGLPSEGPETVLPLLDRWTKLLE